MLFIVFIALVVLAVMATIFTEVEKFGWATVVLLAGFASAQFFHVGGFDVVAYVHDHAVSALIYLLIYVIAGIVWSFVKWFSFLMNARDIYRGWKRTYLIGEKLNPDGQVPDEKADDFRKFVGRQGSYSNREILVDLAYGRRPRASNNKSRIVSWMSFWPCSVIGTLLNDPVRRLFNYVFTTFKAQYQKMADKLFANDKELS